MSASIVDDNIWELAITDMAFPYLLYVGGSLHKVLMGDSLRIRISYQDRKSQNFFYHSYWFSQVRVVGYYHSLLVGSVKTVGKQMGSEVYI